MKRQWATFKWWWDWASLPDDQHQDRLVKDGTKVAAIPPFRFHTSDGCRQTLEQVLGALKAPPMGVEDIALALANLQMP